MKFNTARRVIPALILLILFSGFAPAPRPVMAGGPVKTSRAVQPGTGWTVVATTELILGQFYDSLYMMDNHTRTVYGPFLRDELTRMETGGVPDGNDLLQAVITPDGSTVILSSPSGRLIHFVRIVDPLFPVYLGSLQLDIPGFDLAVSADGKYALVTSFSLDNMYSINISTRKVAYELVLPTIGRDAGDHPVQGNACSVAVARNGAVVVADNTNGAILHLTLRANGTITYNSSVFYYLSPTGVASRTPATGFTPIQPVNVSISPDGKTVLVSDALNYAFDPAALTYTNTYALGVLRIPDTGPMELVNVISGLSHAAASIAFTPDGSKAVVYGNTAGAFDAAAVPQYSTVNDSLFGLNIRGAGNVELNASQSVLLDQYTTAPTFGVDPLVIHEGLVYASYPYASLLASSYPDQNVSIVDLASFELLKVSWGLIGTKYPVGLAVIPDRLHTYLPLMFH